MTTFFSNIKFANSIPLLLIFYEVLFHISCDVKYVLSHLFDPSSRLRNGLEVGNVVGGEVRVFLQEPSHVTVNDLAAAEIFRDQFIF